MTGKKSRVSIPSVTRIGAASHKQEDDMFKLPPLPENALKQHDDDDDDDGGEG